MVMKKTLFFFVSLLAITMNVYAQHVGYGPVTVNNGQTIYVHLIDNHAEIIYPDPSWTDNYNFNGYLEIPDVIYYNNTAFPVTIISDGAFYQCSGLTSVLIPNTVTTICESAFERCTGLTSVNIPNSVTAIGISVFQDCSALTSVSLPNTITSIPYKAFYYCTNLSSVVIPNSVTHIGQIAFCACYSLTTLTVGSAVNGIDLNAFEGCGNLTTIYMRCYPPSIESTTFKYVPVNATIYTPCGALSAYQNATHWSNFTHYVEGCMTISVSVNDITLGGVSGAGQYSIGDTVRLTATPFAGAHFIGWSNGSQENPLVFVAATGDASYTAIFGTGQEGIDNVDGHNINVVFNNGQIVVEDADGSTVTLYDVNGRLLSTKRDDYAPLRFDVPASGTYMIKIGLYPARKVVVVK